MITSLADGLFCGYKPLFGSLTPTLLSILAEESEYIQSRLFKNSMQIAKRRTEVIYYDCTNFYFEIEEAEDDKQYGVCKENRPLPIVEMGLFMDRYGIPLAFCINPGNQNEQ